MSRLLLLLGILSSLWISRIWYDYPFSDYGIGINLVRTKGEILSSSVRESDSRGRNTFYEPAISYKYEVNGTTYVSSKFSVSGAPSRLKQEAAQLAGRYKPGDIELVYFAPTNPEFALLEKAFPWHYLGGTIFYLAFAVFIFIVGMVFIVQDKDKKSRDDPGLRWAKGRRNEQRNQQSSNGTS